MKFLVLAFDASRGLVLEVKVLGRLAMACKCRPLFRGDLLLCFICFSKNFLEDLLRYETGLNLSVGAIAKVSHECCGQRSLP